MTAADKKAVAERIAEALVKEQLAACVQITCPVKSVYRWQGKTERAKEYLVFIKTGKKLYKRVEKTIKKLHTYTVPEIISVDITDGNPDYINWMKDNLLKR